MNFIVAASTDVGIKKLTNQDSYCVRLFNTKQGKIVMAVLCDGMGGLSKGEVASATLINAFCQWSDNKLPILCEKGITDADIINDWKNIVSENNEKIKVYARSCGMSMGTTVTAILLTERKYYVINVGDSRIYEITDSANQLTQDQTVVAREVAAGNLTLEEAKHDPRRSVLLQCVGASSEVCPDMFLGETKLNTVYMLCSDGFVHEISSEEIYDYLNPRVMIDANGMKKNMDLLIELNKQREEQDNISVVSIRTF